MDYPNEKGVTNRQHLDQVWKQTGVKPENYKEIDIPHCAYDLYSIFWELRNFCSESITWSDIYAYCQLREIRLTGEDLAIIKKLNLEYIRWTNKKIRSNTKKPTPKKPKPPIKKR